MKILWMHPSANLFKSDSRSNYELLKHRSLTNICVDVNNNNRIYKHHCAVDRTGIYVPKTALKFDISNYIMPELQSNFKALDKCISDRCQEIFEKNKQIILFYSGGMDSLCCLVGFIKNYGISACAEKITIFANEASIRSLPDFYNKHILDNFNIVSSTNSNITLLDDKYSEHIIVSGDPANLFDDTVLIDATINLGIPLDSKYWKQEIKNHHEVLFDNCCNDSYNHLIYVIESSADSRNYSIDNVFDFIWWYNNNLFQISHSIKMLHFFYQLLIKYRLGKDYWHNRFVPFFNTDDFTRWSYNVKQEVMEYKMQENSYIYKQHFRRYIEDIAGSNFISKHYNNENSGLYSHVLKGIRRFSILTSDYVPV